PALAHIPVVLLTGAFEPVDENRARAVGCDGVLVKPFEPQIVISRVKDLLAGKQPSGMWGSAPVAQGPVRQAPAAGEFTQKGAAPPAAAGDSLEAYFDHLDAAFASGSDAVAPAAPRPAAVAPRANDPLADWDPDLKGDPARPAPRAAPQAPAAQPAPPAAPPPLQIPSLVDAFTALLAAEQKTALTPSAAAAPPSAPAGPPAATDAIIHAIAANA